MSDQASSQSVCAGDHMTVSYKNNAAGDVTGITLDLEGMSAPKQLNKQRLMLQS
jgi:hypothetical protein